MALSAMGAVLAVEKKIKSQNLRLSGSRYASNGSSL
jgi:hypothetical protein